jgi:hypothetical protein
METEDTKKEPALEEIPQEEVVVVPMPIMMEPATQDDSTSVAANLVPRDIPTLAAPTPLTAAGRKKASYGALISIVIIMAVVIVGAFYAWGKRISENTDMPASTATPQTY